MSAMDILRREVKVLVFDQYGTVVDMHRGLTDAVTPFLQDKGWDGSPHRFVTWWRRTHFENSMIDSLCDRGHTSYRQIGHRAVSLVMDRAGIAHTQEEVGWLVSQIETLRPFDDVLAALGRLHRHYRLAILSNGDPDMLEAAKPHIGFAFDETISVQRAGYFKPHWRSYACAEEILDTHRSGILFVANHEFDVVGAKAFGMRTAFIERRQRPLGAWPQGPDIIVPDFESLANGMCPPAV